jgi:hypothetical protein
MAYGLSIAPVLDARNFQACCTSEFASGDVVGRKRGYRKLTESIWLVAVPSMFRRLGAPAGAGCSGQLDLYPRMGGVLVLRTTLVNLSSQATIAVRQNRRYSRESQPAPEQVGTL